VACRTKLLLTTVRNALNAENIRPLCDLVPVQSAEVIESPITATMYLQPGAAGEVAAAQARKKLDAWLLKVRRLGAGLPRSGIDAALHQPGMSRIDIDAPRRGHPVHENPVGSRDGHQPVRGRRR
jgi:phage-related baseplate assembly protein